MYLKNDVCKFFVRVLLVMVAALSSLSLQAAGSPEGEARFGFAINPFSLPALATGVEGGLLSLEFAARSEDSRFELAMPIWYQNLDYDGPAYGYGSGFPRDLEYKYFAMDLALRYYINPETSRFYIGPVLRYQHESGGLADWETYPEYVNADESPKIRQSHVGAGVTVGFGRKQRRESLIQYWGSSLTFGRLLGGDRKPIEYPFGFFNFMTMTSSGSEEKYFWDFTFFRWGLLF